MSVKKDAAGRRFVQVEAVVPGTPEEVWQAIATGEGVSSWFVPTEVREDGSIVSRFGPGMEAVARRTLWEPPHRFAGEGAGFGPGAPPVATEWTVEAQAGGTCVVRVVHSLFASGDDWDNQLEGLESGWPSFFQILRLYLTHFRGQPCVNTAYITVVPGDASPAWEAMTASLGLAGAAKGERRATSPGAPPLAGLVELAGANAHQLLLRLDQPTPGIAHLFAHPMGAQVCLAIRLYLYGDEAPRVAARDEPRWQAWISARDTRVAVPVNAR